ncbi:MAG: hypothetical protein AAF658_00090 [Myxococcota bacterium]
MPTWTLQCFSCRHTNVFEDLVRRSDTCSHCGADARVCKNCVFYDPGSHNQCRETTAEYVSEKERSNFCGMFKPFTDQREAADDVDAAKAALEALFKK